MQKSQNVVVVVLVVVGWWGWWRRGSQRIKYIKNKPSNQILKKNKNGRQLFLSDPSKSHFGWTDWWLVSCETQWGWGRGWGWVGMGGSWFRGQTA